MKVEFLKSFKSKVFKSFSYMMISQALYSICSFLMGIITSRYYGPQIMGGYNYALSYVTIFSPLLLFGLDSIVIKDFAEPEKKSEILGSAIFVFIIGQTAAVILSILTMRIMGMDKPKIVFGILFMIPWLFSFLSGYKFYLIAKSDLREFTIYWSIQTVLFFTIKSVIAIKRFSIVWFAVAYSAELIVTYVIMYASYLKNGTCGKLCLDKHRIIKYFRIGFPFMLSSVASTMYMKIDQVMVGNMIGDRELGVYSIAVSLSECWYILPTTIYTATLPAIAMAYNQDDGYMNKLQKLADTFAIVGYFAVLVIPFAGKVFVPILYGEAYEYAASLMLVYVIAGFCVCIGYAFSTFLSVREKSVYSMVKTIIGCVANIVLNYFMIPVYGSMGAVFATVITQFITGILVNSIAGIWNEEIRNIVYIQYKSLFPFVRLAGQFKKENV